MIGVDALGGHSQQCYRCNRQTSITAGTIFEATKLPLTVWFQGIYFMTQDKKGASAMKLHRQLGISYNAAWRMRHKLMQVMMERDREHVLGGFIQLDDAYLGGERSGGKRGRGAPGKTPFVAAVETDEAGHPQRVKLTVAEGFRLTEIAAWAQQHLSPGTQVLSDGLSCFNGVTAAGCIHESMVTGGGKAAVERPEFRWVNTILGNIKSALRGTYHAIRPKYAQRYLAEFEYRFNRRFDLPDIIPRLVYVALRTPPMPECVCPKRHASRTTRWQLRSTRRRRIGARALLQVGRNTSRRPGQRFATGRPPPNLGARDTSPGACRQGPYRP